MPNLKIEVLNVVLYSISDAAAMEESKTGKKCTYQVHLIYLGVIQKLRGQDEVGT